MRVPSVGLSLDERRFIDEGYAFAERALRGYRDPPSLLVVMFRDWIAGCRRAMHDLYRAAFRT
jgi:hypothetical protein